MLLGQPGYLGRRPLFIGELGVRRPAPERQCLPEVVPGLFGLAGRVPARHGEQGLEPPGVHGFVRQPQRVPGRCADEDPGLRPPRAPGFENPPEVGHVRLQRRDSPRWRLAPPELIDHAVDGYHPAALHQQQGEDRPLQWPAQIRPGALDLRFQRSEDPDPRPHGVMVAIQTDTKPAPNVVPHAGTTTSTSQGGKLMTISTAIQRPDTHDMIVVHRVFRRESDLMPTLIRAVPDGDTARARVLADAFDDYQLGLHLHHTGEDELVWPLLLARVDLEADMVLRMETQHEVVAGTLAEASRRMPAWRSAPSSATAAPLVSALTEHRAALLEHLDDEEEYILPLIEEHLTVAEWARLGQRFAEEVPRAGVLPLAPVPVRGPAVRGPVVPARASREGPAGPGSRASTAGVGHPSHGGGAPWPPRRRSRRAAI